MKTTERIGAPAIASGLAYFTIKVVTPELEWLTSEDQVEAIAMLFPIYAHILFEFRALISWIGLQIKRKNNV